MKVTTEKLPGSLVALEIELDRDQVEKGLERAARRLSQKYNIPGFRKGKAPRFIVENYFGRPALLEEATDDMLQKAFKSALEQENVDPIGQANLDHVHFNEEPYHFRVIVPVSPTVVLSDYRAIRSPIETQEVTDEMVQRALETRRDKHAVLRELDEPRPAQQGDELSVEMEALVDGEPVEPRPEGQPISPSTLVLEPERLVEGLYEGLLGATVDQELEIKSQMAEDHPNEKLQGKEVIFATKVLGIKERLLPDWDELPTLEEFDGTLDELREKTREELIESAKSVAERDSANGYIRQLVDASTFDIPEVLIERQADGMLKDQEQEYTRYGITPDQVYQYRGVKREDLIRDLLPEAEGRLKTTLALQSVVRGEGLSVTPEEVDAELESTLATYNEEQRDQMRQLLGSSYLSVIAETALDKKLRGHVLLLANGSAPSQQEGAAQDDTTEAAEVAESQPEAAEQVEG